MIKLVGLKTDAADPGSYFARNRVGDHERTLHHLPMILDRVKRRHHGIFFTIRVPSKNFHRSFFLKAFPDLFFTVPLIDHVLPAVTFFHVFLQIIFMTFPYSFYKALRIECFLESWHPLRCSFLRIGLHFYVDSC